MELCCELLKDKEISFATM